MSTQVPATEPLPRLNVALWQYQPSPGQLIPLLQKAQDTYGYVSKTAISYISGVTHIPESDIYGVITFYKQFRLRPIGKYMIRVCDGTACHVNDSRTLIEVLEDELHLEGNDTTEDGLFTVDKVACIGCCSLAPVIMINDETYGRLTAKKLRSILKRYRKQAKQAQQQAKE